VISVLNLIKQSPAHTFLLILLSRLKCFILYRTGKLDRDLYTVLKTFHDVKSIIVLDAQSVSIDQPFSVH